MFGPVPIWMEEALFFFPNKLFLLCYLFIYSFTHFSVNPLLISRLIGMQVVLNISCILQCNGSVTLSELTFLFSPFSPLHHTDWRL